MARNKQPTPGALKAAQVYLRKIDGNDFGDPEHGHDVNELARIIDRYVKGECLCAEGGLIGDWTNPKCPLHGYDFKNQSQREGLGN